MWRALKWMMVAVLCSASGIAAGEEQPDARLLEAKKAFDEATHLGKAGRYADAIPKAEAALSAREVVLGGTHPDVADCLNLLGTLFAEQQDLARAEPLLQRGLAVREATLGKNHPRVAQSLNNLAILYADQGLYTRAEPLYQRALAIREATLGEHHPHVALSLNSLADFYCGQGLYARAEPLYERALAIREATFGKNHPDVAQSLNSLAILYADQGLYARAESLYARALAILEANLGKHHPDVVPSLNNLADIYREQGLYARAESLYARALAIWEATLGTHHPDVALLLNSLATLYAEQGLYTQAELLCVRALAILEAALGTHHPHVAFPLNNLAKLYFKQGKYVRAEALYQRALSIRDAALGRHHPNVALSLNNLAQVHFAQDRIIDAMPLLTRAFTISERRLRHEALDFSESRLTSFLQLLHTEEEHIYALLRNHPDDASVRRLALTTVLLRKGRSVEEIADTSRTIYRNLSPQDRDTFEQLRGLRTQLAQLSLEEQGVPSPADYQQRLNALAEAGDTLETNLARRSAPLRALTALPPPEEIVERVAATLPPGGALVEFIACSDQPFITRQGGPNPKQPTQFHYLVLVLFPDSGIRTLDLGPAEAIDRAASNLLGALSRRDPDYQRSAQALYSLVFQPLLPLLGDVRRLFLAPDGQLGLIPFEVLHDGQGSLVDTFAFTYLTSGKDLLPRDPSSRPTHSVVVLAAPDFDASAAMSSGTHADTASSGQRAPALERFFSTLRTGSVLRSWAPLPGTRREAEAIQRLLPQAQFLLGPNATKQQLLHLVAPSVLHIATHGFFLEDAATPSNSRGLGHVGGMSGSLLAHFPPDPLLRSGLVLAGARASSTLNAPGPASSQAKASFVTALELAGLDLWGTQLVVLSACDTGRGDVKLGQGVYGLRRAFIIAGAETVVMSLWKVNDDSTHLLMEDYYRHLLAGKGRAQALRDAVRTLRETRPHPYYWAPFIALGQDAPLRLLAQAPHAQLVPPPLPRHASPEPR